MCMVNTALSLFLVLELSYQGVLNLRQFTKERNSVYKLLLLVVIVDSKVRLSIGRFHMLKSKNSVNSISFLPELLRRCEIDLTPTGAKRN